MSSFYRTNDASVIHEVLDGEAVMLNLDTGNYFTLNPSGGLVWQLLQGGIQINQIVTVLSKMGAASQSVKGDVDAFIAKLLEQGLIIPVAGVAATPQPENSSGAMTYSPPELHVFSDMQELLLLDPVHEISEQGWPHTASTKT